MSLILQLETSSEICSVALSYSGNTLYIAESNIPNSHTERLTLLIKECMDQAGKSFSQLDAVAISAGPGSYTSLRVGVSTAKGLCYAIGIPLIAIDSLLNLAYGIDMELINEADRIIPMIDARRMEVYAAVFKNDYSYFTETASVILENDPFHSLTVGEGTIHVCGSGAIKYYDRYQSERIALHHTKTSASYMCIPASNKFEAGQFEDVAYYTPNYFKSPNITKSVKKYF
ncbi:MAG: tRNA (adenosine(37)-N6)-threonylcarbamoyltransferase complex dimerization subunit type 1 TsaB [Saprospiraceae bacterium]|jgi:tRNA threonylcarbamoyladenosine biosynthesis protein TsaB|nr:tRNA (adenosine(37)-N6)-threonylcarbamoyltransferase complex dimerization subunit type 1 TsaB [Saprospiraceae bacterium]MBL0024493.1 tRNA (adenosine(37)-N6)-threonylcarbamoyltransferase complex dimerization subunit type 1 TsaB [Saprospiraceae bacterium]